MDIALELIDQLIAEHKSIADKTKSVNEANDDTFIAGLKKMKNHFAEGKEAITVDIKSLERVLEEIGSQLGKHFSREETVLLPIVEKDGNEKLLTALNPLLFEHSDLRDRLVHIRKRVDELKNWSLAQDIWYSRAGDLRVYITHTTKLIETHAARENHLLKEFRQYLKKQRH